MTSPRKTAALHMEIPDLGAKIRVMQVLMPKAFDRGLEAGIRAATIEIQQEVKRLLDGVVLHRRTHRLWRSIQPEVYRRAGSIVGIVGTDVEYAAIHEFGGVIRPKSSGRFLMFEVGGQFRMVREVKIPKRPYMSRAFKSKKRKVGELIQNHVIKAAKKTLRTGEVSPVTGRRGVGFNAD